MTRAYVGIAGALGLLLVLPAGALAQSGGEWWSWAYPLLERQELRTGASASSRDGGEWIRGRRDGDDDDRWERDDDDDDRRERARDRRGRDAGGIFLPGRTERGSKNGKGPAFCRSGEGHPVHGRRWCMDKGFGLGRGSILGWQRAPWEDIRYEPRRSRAGDVVGRGTLADILGDVVFGRLADAAGTTRLDARWLEPRRSARVLQVRAAGRPLAELTDSDGDGRMDVVLLAPRR